jgi:ACS family D-galactonate transporter-like MFS transporter
VKQRSNWALLLLLALSVLINYLDRGNLSIAAPSITKELVLSDTQMGMLLSAFFWTYAAFQLVSGWLVDRYDVRWVYAGGYLLWSVATLAIGLAGSFAALVAMRLALGVGESVAYPAYSKILSAGFREEERGLANGLIDVGTKFGPALGTLLGGWLIFTQGWRFFFVVTGAVSLLWLVPWILYAPPISQSPADAPRGPGWRAIIAKRSAWATFLGLLCHNYNWYFLLTWLPTYLVKERHFSNQMMIFYNALPLCATAAATMIAGWLSDRLIARGARVAVVRKRFLMTGMGVAAACLPFINTPVHALSMTLLVITFIGIGIYTSNCWALTQYLSGREAAGKWTGLQNAIGNLGGVIAPAITGVVVDRLHSFQLAFVVSSCVLLAGVGVYRWMLLDRMEGNGLHIP